MGAAKAAAFGCLAVAVAPLVAVGTAFARLYVGTAKYAIRYPKLTVAGVLAASMIAYNCHGEDSLQRAQAYARRGGALMERAAETYAERREAAQVARYAKGIAMQNIRLGEELRRQHEHASRLEDRLAQAERELRTRDSLPRQPPGAAAQPPAQAAPTPERQHVLQHPDYYFYYVDIDETIDQIGRQTGNSRASSIIAADNAITDPRALLAGQLLKVKRSLFSPQDAVPARMRAQTPLLESVILPGNLTITEFCQGDAARAEATLALNRGLGLSYRDSFPYKRGARVVYYQD